MAFLEILAEFIELGQKILKKQPAKPILKIVCIY